MLREAAQDLPDVPPLHDDPVGDLEARRRILGDHRVGDLLGDLLLDQAQHRQHVRPGDPPLAERAELVEHPLGVPERPVGRAGDELQRRVVDDHAFASRHRPQAIHDRRLGNPLEVEPLGAGRDRRRETVGFGRHQDEHRVRGRLFQGLQQRVRRLHRQHVRFIDDVDLVPALHRHEFDLFP